MSATKPLVMGPFTTPMTPEQRQRFYVFVITCEVHGYDHTVLRVDARDGNPGFVTATVWPHKQSPKHAQGAHSNNG